MVVQVALPRSTLTIPNHLLRIIQQPTTFSNMSASENERTRKKAEQKEFDKAEATKRGVTYKQVRAERKKREADALDTSEHNREVKRLRAYSHDFEDGSGENNYKRRTRSVDVQEGKQAAVQAETALSVEEWRKEHNITIQGHGRDRSNRDFPDPYRTFEETPFNERVKEGFSRAGFTAPTPIQGQAWPIALQSKDMICIAKTGSGKTCGFLLPAFHQFLQKGPPPRGFSKPKMLVLAPTRELSVQIMEEAVKFGRPLAIRSLCCYGGSSKYPQIAALQRGVECCIATPGRLNDLIEMGKVDLSGIEFLVLDEADRMLDMGFEPQIRSIIKCVPDTRQTLLFSATWPREIQTLAHDFLKDPIQINVGEVNALVANKDIEQTIVMCHDGDKFDKLTAILKELVEQKEELVTTTRREAAPVGGGKEHAKIIVFVAKKVSCNDLANRLWDDGFAVDSLHGDRPQWERTRVMSAFKAGQLRVLIATDVAARGLDVKDVGCVVNYDMPAGVNAVEDYVHRIGRTGRAGAKGRAYTFFTPGDKKCATQLVEVLTKAEQEIPPELQALVRPRFGGGNGRGGRGRGYQPARGGGRGYMGGSGRGYMGGGGGGGGGGRGYGRGGGRGYDGGGRGGGGRGGYRR